MVALVAAAVAPTAAAADASKPAAAAAEAVAFAVAANDTAPPPSITQDTATPPASVTEDMVLVPAGEFLMGSNDADNQAESNEKPQRTVSLPDFYIDQFEVTNIQYKRFVDATGYPAPLSWKEGHYADEADFYPIVEVTWWDAMAYARWAGKRLPTEAEWEKAARGTDGRRYPWGNKYNSHLANTGRYFAPANAYIAGASPYGVVNMAGNAAEWTASVFAPYPKLEAVLPAEFGGADTTSLSAQQRPEKAVARADTLTPSVVTPAETDVVLDAEQAELARQDSVQSVKDPRRQFFSAAELRDERPRVYRGGSINSYPRFLRCANRAQARPDARWYNIGFRCAMDAPATAPTGER